MEFRSKRRPVPREFVGMVNAGFDYDHSNTEQENRQRAHDEGYCDPELVSDEEYDAWLERGEKLGFDAAEHQWALGDWIVEGEDLWDLATAIRNRRFKHGVYMAAADITGFRVDTIKDYAYVARNVPEGTRVKTLSFGHHKLIAAVPHEQQVKFLAEMQSGGLNVGDARRRIKYLLSRAKPEPNDKANVSAEPKPKSKPKLESKEEADARAEQIIRLCDQLIELLSQDHLAAATPAAYWTLTHTVATANEVLEEIATASVHTDA
jgi:hypothetical protein